MLNRESNLRSDDSYVQVHIDPETHAALEEYLKTDLHQEIGGILLGQKTKVIHGVLIEVTGFLPAKYSQSFITEFRFNHEIWRELYSLKANEFPNTDILGWFHSHPSMSLIPTEEDLNIQKTFFQQPHYIAYITDPIHGKTCIYSWESHSLVAIPDFYVGGKLYSSQAPIDEQPPEASVKTLAAQVSEETSTENHQDKVARLNTNYLEVVRDLNEQLKQFQEVRENHKINPEALKTPSHPNNISQTLNSLPPAMQAIIGVTLVITLALLGLYPLLKTAEDPSHATSIQAQKESQVSPASIPPVQEVAKPNAPETAETPENPDTPEASVTTSVYTNNVAVYYIQKGDSLWTISERYYGSGFKFYKLIEHNGIIQPHRLQTGMKIEVPLEN